MAGPYELKDRRKELFGRSGHIAALVKRAGSKGLTAVAARPLMGKTWTLQELGRTLWEEHGYLVGYHECTGPTTDLFLRAVADLYARWLASATYRKQAKSLWRRHKGSAITGLGQAVGTVVAAFESAFAPWRFRSGKVGGLVSKAFDGLAGANRDLTSGGQELPQLSYDQARDLVKLVAALSDKPIVLILDAWEQSELLKSEYRMLQGFVGHLDDWPRCHIFAGLRLEAPAHGFAADLAASRSEAKIFPLDAMDLADVAERQRMLNCLRERVMATRDVDDDKIIGMVAGFPGVLNYWMSDGNRQAMADTNDLQSIAAEAQAYRYREFEELLAGLSDGNLTLALRLALFPRLDEFGWRAFRAILLHDLDESLIHELSIRQVLAGREFPTFGHETRHAAAQRWFVTHNRYGTLVREEAENLIFRLGAGVHSLAEETRPLSAAIVAMVPLAAELGLGDEIGAIQCAAMSLFPDIPPPDSSLLLKGARPAVARDPQVSTLIAMALVNTHADAKNEGDLKRRDSLLDELRALSSGHSEDAAVRERLAGGLFNTLNHAKDEGDLRRRDSLLDELRALSSGHPEDAAAREKLAMGLFNTLNHAKREDDLPRRDSLLDELRALSSGHPEDAAVRQQLAMGLSNTLVDAKDEEDLPRRDSLLDELRALSSAHPDDAAVRERLAMGLFNTLYHAKDEGNLERRPALIVELGDVLAALSPENEIRLDVERRLAVMFDEDAEPTA